MGHLRGKAAAVRSRAQRSFPRISAMTARENPIGLDGFEFVEFTSPDPGAMAAMFNMLGFTHVGNHRSKNVRHYAQGDINFILNMEPAGQVADFRTAHGPSANGMAFRVEDAEGGAEARGRARRHRDAEPARAGRAGTSRPSKALAARSSIWSTATARSRSTTWISSRWPARDARRQQRRPAHARPSHPQCEPRPDGPLGEILRDASSTSARSAISTSRASRPACSRGR